MLHDGSTVLVVDDSPIERTTAVDLFTRLGFSVLDAYSGAAALRILDEHPEVSLLFADVRMPGMSGPRLAETAQARRPGLKVVLTSGDMNAGETNAGFVFVPKPWRLDAIEKAVKATSLP
jgi:CheY-like chemotaxis protein